jgi:shikimate kinase
MSKIALIGPMGVGKSTIAKKLAERIGHPFVDLDQYITERSGKDIPTLFHINGERGFRVLECQSLRDINSRYRSCTLATGGGTILSESCRKVLQASWHCVFLNASVDTLVEHVLQDDVKRPLLDTDVGLAQRISQIVEERYHWYQSMAEVTMVVDGQTVSGIVDRLIDILSQRGIITRSYQ